MDYTFQVTCEQCGVFLTCPNCKKGTGVEEMIAAHNTLGIDDAFTMKKVAPVAVFKNVCGNCGKHEFCFNQCYPEGWREVSLFSAVGGPAANAIVCGVDCAVAWTKRAYSELNKKGVK